MAVILNIQNLIIPNALAVGGDATGNSSTFFILPMDGYFIAASQFTLAEDALATYPEISEVTFGNTTTPFASDNKVAVNVFWDDVTLLNDDYEFTPQIIFNNNANVYDSEYTALSFSINSILNPGTNASITVEPCIGSVVADNVSITETVVDTVATHYITADINSTSQVDVVDITYGATDISGNSEGYARLSLNELTSIINQSINSDGNFTVTVLNFEEDLFGSVYRASYRVSYTRSNSSTIDTDTTIDINVPVVVYTTNFLASYTFDESGHDEFQMKFTTNIADAEYDIENYNLTSLVSLSPATFNFTYSPDTFVSNGATSNTLIGSTYTFHVDVLANTSGSTRDVIITLKDTLYNITRATQTVTQQATNFINAKISNIGLDDIVALGTYQANADFLTSLEIDSGKVISIPNGIDGDNTYEGGGGGDYGVPADEYVGIQAYSLVVTVDSSVTLSDFTNNNINLNVDQQEIYPLDTAGEQSGFEGWVVFNFDDAWTEVGTNMYARQFYIRNQDAFDTNNFEIPTADRNATITVTHPTTNVTSSVTIEQDKRYNSSSDKVQAKTVKPSGDAATDAEFSAVAYVEGSTLQTTTVTTVASVGVGTYETRLKFVDFETDFNLHNNVTTNPASHTFKQYPLPRFKTSLGSAQLYADPNEDGLGYVVYDDNSFYQDYIDDAQLVYNLDYDSSDPNNDHHYTFRWQMANNDSFSSRSVFFYWFHPENEKILNVGNHDLRLRVVQSALASLEASIVNSSGNIAPLWDLNTPFPLSNDGAANSRTVRIIYSGDVAPTIGIIKETILGLNPYVALAPNTNTSTLIGVDDGFSYSTPTAIPLIGVDGANAIEITVSCDANVFGQPGKQVNFGFWHATLDPTQDDPSDAIAFTQGEVAYNPNAQAIEVFSNTPIISLDSNGGVIKFLINVEDYATSPSTPDVEVYAYNGPIYGDDGYLTDANGDYTTVSELTGSQVISNTIDLTTAGLVLLNAQYPANGPLTNYDGSEVLYTHYVEIPYTPYSYSQPYYIMVRAKHSAATVYSEDDAIIYTLVDNSEEVFIKEAGPPNANIININTANVKTVEIPGDYGADQESGSSLNIKVAYTRPEQLTSISDLPFGVSSADYVVSDEDGVEVSLQQKDYIVYGNLQSYIYARFINPAYINESTGAVDNANASIWTNPTDDTVFLDENGAQVDAYGTQNALATPHDLPAGFNYLTLSGNLRNSAYVVKNPNFDGSLNTTTLGVSSPDNDNYSEPFPDLIPPEVFGEESTYLGSHSFIIQLGVKPHNINATIDSVIGIWTGKSFPKTNFYKLGSTFIDSTSTFQQTVTNNIFSNMIYRSNTNNNNFAGAGAGTSRFEPLENSNSITYNSISSRQTIFNNYLLKAFDNSGDGKFDSFHWNSDDTYYFDIYNNEIPDYRYFQFAFCLFDDSTNTFLQEGNLNQDYFIEYEIVNYTDNLPPYEGVAIAGFEIANNSSVKHHKDNTGNAVPPESGGWGGNDITLRSKLLDLSKVYSDGFYRTRIRIGQNEGGGGIHVPFTVRTKSKFTLKNLKIYKGAEESMLTPGTTSIFTTPPDDYIYIKHLPKPPVAISFESFVASNNSPLPAIDIEQNNNYYLDYFPGLGDNLPNSNGVGLSSIQGSHVFKLYIAPEPGSVPAQFGSPHIRTWDGTNNSEGFPSWFNDGGVNIVTGSGEFRFEIQIDDNYTGYTRQVTLGLYDGVPVNSTTAPLDTYTISQTSQNTAIDFPGSNALQSFSSGTVAGGVPIAYHFTGDDGTKLYNVNSTALEHHANAVIPFEPFTDAHLADYTNDDNNNFGLYKIIVSGTDQFTTLNYEGDAVLGTQFATLAHPLTPNGNDVGIILEDLHAPFTNTYYKAYNDPTLDNYDPGKNFARTLNKENISTVAFKPGINFESVGRYLVLNVYEGYPAGYSVYTNINGYGPPAYNLNTSSTPPLDTFVIYQMPFGQTFNSLQSGTLASVD